MKVCFTYSAPLSGFTGQVLATHLLLEHLPPNFDRKPIRLPVWYGSIFELPAYLLALIAAWFQIVRTMRTCEVFYINAGQSLAACVRDGLSLWAARIGNSRCKRLISFNGNIFTTWEVTSFKARLFSRVCNMGNVVTIVGPNQKKSLIKLGVNTDIRVVDNASELEVIESTSIGQKHTGDILKILFLGNLLETKGYPEYLEALANIAERGDLRVDAVLAGDFIVDCFPIRFSSKNEAEKWVADKTAEINRSASVRVRWIRGISGAKKVEALRQAQILVFPSAYPIEAQPFVLLEALASGIAILTSKAGEIATSLTEDSAVFIEPCTVPMIIDGIYALRDPETRVRLATSGVRQFRSRYSLSKYLEVWEKLIIDP